VIGDHYDIYIKFVSHHIQYQSVGSITRAIDNKVGTRVLEYSRSKRSSTRTALKLTNEIVLRHVSGVNIDGDLCIIVIIK